MLLRSYQRFGDLNKRTILSLLHNTMILTPSCISILNAGKLCVELRLGKIAPILIWLLLITSHHQKVFEKYLNIPISIPSEIQHSIIDIIHCHWDSVIKEGAGKPAFGYEFCMDIGYFSRVCFQPSNYGIHESKIMTTQISQLEDVGWVSDRDGSWGSMTVSALNLHQEDITSTDDFVWILYVSHRVLNIVTETFIFPINHCQESVQTFGDSNGSTFYIKLYNRQ